MRTLPEDAITVRAPTELLEVSLGERLQSMLDVRFGDGFDQPVAFHAASKRLDESAKVEATHDFDYLLARIYRPNEVAVSNRSPFQ